MGAIAADEAVRSDGADAGQGEREAGHGGGGVAADKVYAVDLAGMTDASVERLDIFHREAFGEPEGDGELRGPAVHGVDVGEVDDGGFVAEVFQGRIGEVEVDTLEQQVGGDEREIGGGMADGGGIVAYAEEGAVVAGHKALCQSVNESKLA